MVQVKLEVLQVKLEGADKPVDADEVLVQVNRTRCFLDGAALESAAQVQLQYLGQKKVWTVEMKAVEALQP